MLRVTLVTALASAVEPKVYAASRSHAVQCAEGNFTSSTPVALRSPSPQNLTSIPPHLLDLASGHGYVFSEHYFGWATNVWALALSRWRGEPVHALEVGSFEGKSAVWLLEHVLSHPDATITCVDTWLGSVEHSGVQKACLHETFTHNTARFGARVMPQRGDSKLILQALPSTPHFHIIYVDGDHSARAAFNDGMLSFPMLHVGGVMIFDDFGYYLPSGTGWDAPMAGILAFKELHSRCARLDVDGYQLFFTKVCHDAVGGLDADYPSSIFEAGLAILEAHIHRSLEQEKALAARGT